MYNYTYYKIVERQHIVTYSVHPQKHNQHKKKLSFFFCVGFFEFLDLGLEESKKKNLPVAPTSKNHFSGHKKSSSFWINPKKKRLTKKTYGDKIAIPREFLSDPNSRKTEKPKKRKQNIKFCWGLLSFFLCFVIPFVCACSELPNLVKKVFGFGMTLITVTHKKHGEKKTVFRVAFSVWFFWGGMRCCDWSFVFPFRGEDDQKSAIDLFIFFYRFWRFRFFF